MDIREWRSPDGELLRQLSDAKGDPLFVARDVCEALGLQNPADVLAKQLDGDEKGVAQIYTPGGPQQMAVVTEPGLYKLIMRSRKPAAKAFARWVTHEVLPSIRKTGGYGEVDPSALVERVIASVLSEALPRVVQAALDVVDQRVAVKLDGLSMGRVRPWEAGSLKRRLTVAAGKAQRIGIRSTRSARSAFESRVRTACGWTGAGARLDAMPATMLPHAEREMAAIERELDCYEPKAVTNGRQLSLLQTTAKGDR